MREEGGTDMVWRGGCAQVSTSLAAFLLFPLKSKVVCCLLSSPSPRARTARVATEKSRPWSPSASYDLRERLCPGSALGNPGGPEQRVPTDEAEAQMLGSADLDDMKSE